MDGIDFSVVVPVFNSEATLKEFFQRINETFNSMKKSFEVIFIDDGSRDKSWKILGELKKENPGVVTAIRLNKNFGQHNATFCGFNFAKGNYIVTIDDDLQNPPEEIPKLISRIEDEDCELVYGIYKEQQHSFIRKLASRLVRKYSDFWLSRHAHATSFRLIKKELLDKILDHFQSFVFIDEMLSWYTDNIQTVIVQHEKRKISKSGYGSGKLLNYFANLVIYYTNIPLKIMVYGGFIFSIVFFVISIAYVIVKIFVENVPLGYTSLIVGILFSTSLILLALGIIGEYLSRLYMVQNKKPPYIIKKVLK